MRKQINNLVITQKNDVYIVTNPAKEVIYKSKDYQDVLTRCQQCTKYLKSNTKVTYEVCFVVEGYITEEQYDACADIGKLECNGFVISMDGYYWLKDGRYYLDIKADTPKQAYEKATIELENEKLGCLYVTNTYLEHVSYKDKYWYSNDL